MKITRTALCAQDTYRQSFLIGMEEKLVFAFAGLWDRWPDKASDTVIKSRMIVIVPPNDMLSGGVGSRLAGLRVK